MFFQVMKRSFWVFGVWAIVFFAACSRGGAYISDKNIKAAADSMVASQVKELEKESAIDLEMRKAIEVKAIADSLVYVAKYGAMPIDEPIATPQIDTVLADTLPDEAKIALTRGMLMEKMMVRKAMDSIVRKKK
jgi:ribosomal protein L17